MIARFSRHEMKAGGLRHEAGRNGHAFATELRDVVEHEQSSAAQRHSLVKELCATLQYRLASLAGLKW